MGFSIGKGTTITYGGAPPTLLHLSAKKLAENFSKIPAYPYDDVRKPAKRANMKCGYILFDGINAEKKYLVKGHYQSAYQIVRKCLIDSGIKTRYFAVYKGEKRIQVYRVCLESSSSS